MPEVKYEIADGVELVEIAEVAGLKIPKDWLSKLTNDLNVRAATKWKKRLSEIVGEVPDGIDFEKLSSAQIAELVMAKVKSDLDDPVKPKKTANEFAAKEEALKKEYAAKELSMKKSVLLAQLRAKLPAVREGLDRHADKILADSFSVEFDGDQTEFMVDNTPFFVNGKLGNIDDLAKHLQKQYANALFTEQKQGFGAHSRSGGAQKIDWMNANDSDFEKSFHMPDTSGVHIS